MKKISFTILALSAISGQVLAADGDALKSGTWNCAAPTNSKFFKGKGAYQVKLTQSGPTSESQVVTLTQGKKTLTAKRSEGNFLVNKSTFTPKKNYGYISLSNEGDESYHRMILSVNSKTGDGSYTGDEFLCTSAVKAEFAPANPVQFSCSTDKTIEGKKQRIEFIGIHLADPNEISLNLFPGQEEWSPIKVTPKNSVLEELNANWSIWLDTDRIGITGDSDGVFMVRLQLFKKTGYKTGFVRVEGGSGFAGKNEYSEVTCELRK